MNFSKHKFTPEEEERIFNLVDKVAGTGKISNEKPHIFLNNISRRMSTLGCKSFDEYFQITKKNPEEYKHLISSLTIHTTYWFREARHFFYIEEKLNEGYFKKPIKVLSMGCSTGEEVYSLALILEKYRLSHPEFDYSIEGIDVDPVSTDKGNKAIYNSQSLGKIPEDFHKMVFLGSGKTEGLLTLCPEIRERCFFHPGNALEFKNEGTDTYDIIFCRNMLIYFSTEQVADVVRQLVARANIDAMLFVGHSEDIHNISPDLARLSGSIYCKSEGASNSQQTIDKNQSKIQRRQKFAKQIAVKQNSTASSGGKKDVDVLIVDDSKTIRKQLEMIITSLDYSILSAGSAEEATKLIEENNFSLIILDLNLPNQNGDAWLQDQRANGLKTPCIIVTGAEDKGEKVVKALGKSAEDLFVKEKLQEKKDKFVHRVHSLIRSKQIFKYKTKQPIVIVDDEEDILELLESLVEEEGYSAKTFTSGDAAYEYLSNNSAHCVFLDHQMPGMKGSELAAKIRVLDPNLPVILITGYLREIRSLEKEGIIYRGLDKPIEFDKLRNVLRDASHGKYSGELLTLDESRLNNLDLVLIGASTGGPQTLTKLLKNVNGSFPPTVIVQHIQPDFQQNFAENMSNTSGLKLHIIDRMQELQPGCIYFANRDKHIEVTKQDGVYYALPSDKPPLKGHRPCVEHLFHSAAKSVDKNTLAMLLTGMGDDGALGLKELRKKGVYTIAQDLESSIVFGMPRVAIELGGASYVAGDQEIKKIIDKIARTYNKKAA